MGEELSTKLARLLAVAELLEASYNATIAPDAVEVSAELRTRLEAGRVSLSWFRMKLESATEQARNEEGRCPVCLQRDVDEGPPERGRPCPCCGFEP